MSKHFMTIGGCAALVVFTMLTTLTMLMPAALAAAGLAQGSLQFEPPEGWIEEAAAAPMRVAQFTLPKAERDAEDAVLVVFYFGGEGGDLEANLERWVSHMEQPDGRPSEGGRDQHHVRGQWPRGHDTGCSWNVCRTRQTGVEHAIQQAPLPPEGSGR